MRRSPVVLGLLALVLTAPAAAHEGAGTGWAGAAIAVDLEAGLFTGSAATFRPSDPLTAGELGALLSAIGSPPATPPADPAAPVTIAQLDAAFVKALGLRAEARAFAAGTRAAGLAPPARFGTEVVARLLGLRTDLPVADDGLELQPQQAATRADAAWSAARVLSLGREVDGGKPAPDVSPVEAADTGYGVASVRGAAASFSLPQLTPIQQEVLRIAVSLIGYPYVWGGEDERTELGFDCSGFVWRVFKLQPYADAPALADVFHGRTAARMAAEVPKAKRIGAAALQPGDVLFIGKRPRSKPAQIGHTSIYLGNGWLIESSGQGVALSQLASDSKTFAWARRPLAEAGLEASQSGVTATAG